MSRCVLGPIATSGLSEHSQGNATPHPTWSHPDASHDGLGGSCLHMIFHLCPSGLLHFLSLDNMLSTSSPPLSIHCASDSDSVSSARPPCGVLPLLTGGGHTPAIPDDLPDVISCR